MTEAEEARRVCRRQSERAKARTLATLSEAQDHCRFSEEE